MHFSATRFFQMGQGSLLNISHFCCTTFYSCAPSPEGLGRPMMFKEMCVFLGPIHTSRFGIAGRTVATLPVIPNCGRTRDAILGAIIL